MTMPSSVAPVMEGPSGRKPQHLSPARIGLYAFLGIAALFFLLPLYVMIVTSLKSMPEIRQGMVLQPSDFLVLKAGSSPETSMA